MSVSNLQEVTPAQAINTDMLPLWLGVPLALAAFFLFLLRFTGEKKSK